MRFGLASLAEAAGGVLVHAIRQPGLVLKKGTVIGEAEIVRLREAGISEISVARLDPGDVGEDAAAHRLALRIADAGVRVEKPFTGRSNLFSEANGVLVIDAATIDAINAVDESVTVATLPNMKAVTEGEMIGTVKIIPFAVPGTALDAAMTAAGHAIRVAPFKPRRVGVVSTLLPGLKPTVVRKTLATLAERLAPAGGSIVADRQCEHRAEALATELKPLLASDAELFIVFGASAITDRRDVIPAGIEAAGGTVEHFGMPVDPGNLLLLGTLGGRPILGAPGCARSPKENGFDWVLQRLLADIPVKRTDIQRLGVGGLLMEIISRPQPRAPGAEAPKVAAIVLAAGRSTRMGSNKLHESLRGKPLLLHAVDAALASHADPVIVVTGHEAARVEGLLEPGKVKVVHNPRFADGLSTSLQAGLAALPADSAGAVVLLGDMPDVGAGTIDALIAEFGARPAAGAIAPSHSGERGNPVLLSRRLVPAAMALTGDTGARKLLDAEDVIALPVDDGAVLSDVDTPEALAALRRRAG